MRFNFKKISAIATSVLLTGMTLGVAAAANYPAPFVEGSVADVAIVWGSGAGVSVLDGVEASNIQLDLQGELPSEGAVSVSGGESFTLEKDNDKFNIGETMTSIYSSLDETEFESALDEGDYDSGDVDVEYNQKVTLASTTLELFADIGYDDKEPTLGFHYVSGDPVLNYTLNLETAVNYSEMVGTDLPFMGTEYYVLEADETDQKLTLLDSASTTVMSENEEVVVGGKVVTVEIGDPWAKFTVDGETVDKMEDGESEELEDGSWIATKEVLYKSKEGSLSSVEFTIGSGKLVLENAEEVEMNDDSVDGVVAYLENHSGELDAITVEWSVDEESYLTEDNSLSMPGFETMQVVYEGLEVPDPEEIEVEAGETLTFAFPEFDLDVFTLNSGKTGIQYLGTEDHPLVVDDAAANIVLEEQESFVLTLIPTNKDLSDAETRYYKVTKIENDSGDIKVSFEDLIGSDNFDYEDNDLDPVDEGNFNFDVVSLVDDANVTMTFTHDTDGTVSMNKVVTKKGLVLTLPYDDNAAASHTVINLSAEPTTHSFLLVEMNEDGDLESGESFKLDVAVDSTEEQLYITDANTTAYKQISNEDVYISYVHSPLATKIFEDRSVDPDGLVMEHHGEEVAATVKVVVGGDTTSDVVTLGNVVIKDTEVSRMSGKHLIVVGGSCINSVAANLLGGSLCGADFSAATGVGSGQFLIKSMPSPYNAAKVALLVAGFEVDDTAAGSKYLTTQAVDTSVGKMYRGTSSTSAELIVG